MADTIPFSAVYLLTLAFIFGVTFKCNALFPSLSFHNSSLLASTIDVDGTNLLRELRGLGKTGLESLGQDKRLKP